MSEGKPVHRERRFAYDTSLVVLNSDLVLPFLAHAGTETTHRRHTILLPFWELEELSPSFAVFRLVDEVWAASSFLDARIPVAYP